MTQILSFLQGSCPPGCVSDDSKLHDYLDSSSKGLYKDIRHLGNPPLFSSSMDGTTKRKLAGDVLALKKLKGMSGGLITPRILWLQTVIILHFITKTSPAHREESLAPSQIMAMIWAWRRRPQTLQGQGDSGSWTLSRQSMLQEGRNGVWECH